MIAFILAVTFTIAPYGTSYIHLGAPTTEAACLAAAKEAPNTIAAMKNGARFVAASCSPVRVPK